MRLLTLGTFDCTHAGHAAFLRRCEAFADEVTVGVNSDLFVSEYRGEAALFDEDERLELVRAMGYEAVLNHGPGHDLIASVAPDVLAIGTDWLRRDYLAQIDVTVDALETWGVALVFVPYTPGISSTELKARCRTS